MTTAHRPTFFGTRGGNEQGGNKLYIPSKMYSAKDLPSNLKLKSRRPGQGTVGDLKGKDFKIDMLEREQQNLKERKGLGLVSSIYEDIDVENNDANDTIDFTSDLPQIEAPKKKQKTEENENNLEDISRISSIKKQNIAKNSNLVFPQDKDYEYESDDSKSDNDQNKVNNLQENNPDVSQEKDDSSSFSSDDEEDSEEELYRELEKIKKLREEQNKQKELEQMEKNKIHIQEEIIKGNPLISQSGYSLKKKWFEDTVFKNQAKNEAKVKKRFINDAVRSDFHKKFLNKTLQ